MAVVIETTLGDLTVDLYTTRRPRACLNFLKLCKMKYYNYNLFHFIQQGFIAQTGDPTGAGDGGESVFGVLGGTPKRYFEGEYLPKIRHTDIGLLSMVSTGENMLGSQFFFTLDSDLTSLDSTHCVIGEVTEGHDVLRKLNEAICDTEHRPYQDIRITHTVILEDPFDDPAGFCEPLRSPSPSEERLQGGRIAPDEAIDETEGKTEQEINEMRQEREAKARATILEIVGDLPDADMAPPENVLFVCKLNPVTTDDDLEIIFSRFGKINSCEVIRDKVSGDSLQYAFVEFDNRKSCEDAYFKMDNVLIDDRRIHVDFSQSVSKVKWRGKGRGVILQNNEELKFDDGRNKNTKRDGRRQDFDGNKRGGTNHEYHERKRNEYDRRPMERRRQDFDSERNRDGRHRYENSSRYDRDNSTRKPNDESRNHRNYVEKRNERQNYHSNNSSEKRPRDEDRSRNRHERRDGEEHHDRRCDSGRKNDKVISDKKKDKHKKSSKSKKSSRKDSTSSSSSESSSSSSSSEEERRKRKKKKKKSSS